MSDVLLEHYIMVSVGGLLSAPKNLAKHFFFYNPSELELATEHTVCTRQG